MESTISNQLVQTQQLSITPRLMEELKILQMSSIDLSLYIEEVLVDNPMLESENVDDVSEEVMENYDELQYDYDGYKVEKNERNTDFTNYFSTPISLREHLLLQLGEIKMSFEYKTISSYIIENIESDGYLGVPLQDIANKLNISLKKARYALMIVQSLEPTGVGARNLKECLLLQLKRNNQLNSVTKSVVLNYLKQLAERKYKEISKKLDICQDEVLAIHNIIRNLSSKPGQEFMAGDQISYIIPELIVRESGEKFNIMFIDEKVHNLGINKNLQALIKSNGSNVNVETNKYLHAKLSKAIEIISAIERRKKTILEIAGKIIEYQNEFFKKGYSFLKPLTLKKIADEVVMHESTISRTVNNKYIQTPRGIFELKFFFSSKVDTSSNTDMASRGVKKAILNTIKNEDKNKPFSDENIRLQLLKDGILIARRTVAKYREELSILPMKTRKVSKKE